MITITIFHFPLNLYLFYCLQIKTLRMNGQLKMRSISLANMKKLILQCANKAISKAEQGNFGLSFLKNGI